MAKRLYTVDDMVAEVRSLLDEENTDAIATDEDILPSMNRGQDFASSVLARRYPEPLYAAPTTLELEGGTQDYDIPEDAFEDRVEKIRISVGGRLVPVQRVSMSEIGDYQTTTRADVPRVYAIYGRKIRFAPTPTGTYDAELTYLRNLDQLVLQQGRLVSIAGIATSYVDVDDVGDDIGTNVEDLSAFVNIVDGQTGIVKLTCQVHSLSGNRVTFKTTPTRTSVLGRTVSGAASLATAGIELDDFLCSVAGTCVPQFKRPLSNYLIEHAVAELTRKLGGAAEMEERVLAKVEQQVERTWAGRENTTRVANRSRQFAPAVVLRRRRLPNSST